MSAPKTPVGPERLYESQESYESYDSSHRCAPGTPVGPEQTNAPGPRRVRRPGA